MIVNDENESKIAAQIIFSVLCKLFATVPMYAVQLILRVSMSDFMSKGLSLNVAKRHHFSTSKQTARIFMSELWNLIEIFSTIFQFAGSKQEEQVISS